MKLHEAYTAEGKRKMPDFEFDSKLLAPELYVPSRELKDTVNVAIWLGKPLLLTGEPGTGKTQLAFSVALNFELGEPLRFNVRTTSVATDLFYKYDAIRHFQYNQNQTNKELTPDEIEKKFITYQPLGLAIRSKKRQVVLIDEIDKAPRDLPNDILNILEDLTFDVPEIGKSFTSDVAVRPFIIFTSNSEKNLPDAFLRRCVYYHIPFPGDDDMFNIIASRTSTQLYSKETIKNVLIPHFKIFRGHLKKKKPSTAELLNWLMLLETTGFGPERFPPLANGSTDYGKLVENDKLDLFKTLPVLSKTEEDLKTVRKLLGLSEM